MAASFEYGEKRYVSPSVDFDCRNNPPFDLFFSVIALDGVNISNIMEVYKTMPFHWVMSALDQQVKDNFDNYQQSLIDKNKMKHRR